MCQLLLRLSANSKILMETFCALSLLNQTDQPNGQNVKTSAQDILADELERKIAERRFMPHIEGTRKSLLFSFSLWVLSG